jgi:RNA polymerase sigma-70 factor (ECF subfamily)
MNTTPISLLERMRQAPLSESWRRFADLYTPLLFYWARRLGLQDADAADLVQDVFLKLAQKLPEFKYDRQHSFRSWLRTVLINQWRTNNRRLSIPADAGGQPVTEIPAPDDAELFGEAEYQRYLAHRALQLMQTQFQPTTWKACWLQTVDGKSAAEVATELGISEGAAYVAKCRVLRMLRQELDGLFE